MDNTRQLLREALAREVYLKYQLQQLKQHNTIHEFTISNGDCIVRCERSPKRDAEIVDKILGWYEQINTVDGESIMQYDALQLEAAPFLADLADDIIKFETEWKGNNE